MSILSNQLELRLAQARGQLARLTPALLARAFAGKLVPQNPNDELAFALLERIRQGEDPKTSSSNDNPQIASVPPPLPATQPPVIGAPPPLPPELNRKPSPTRRHPIFRNSSSMICCGSAISICWNRFRVIYPKRSTSSCRGEWPICPELRRKFKRPASGWRKPRNMW